MSGLRLYLLGSPRLGRDGASLELGRRKAMALLAYLAIRDQSHRRETLATLFWPDYDHSSARADLRRMLSVLNGVLGKGVLAADRESIGLNRETDLWLDINHFHRLLADRETHGHPRDEICPGCLPLLTEAVALYRDDFMTGFTLPDCPEFDEWQFFQTESLRQELASALERLVRSHSIQSEFETAIPHARRWLALDPLHEPAQRHLMQLYSWSGQSAAALRQYEECVRILDEELGVPPEAATTDLYTAIKAKRIPSPPLPQAEEQGSRGAGEKSPSLPSASAPLHNLPPQLTPFIGREEELAKIRDLIQDEPACRLLTLVGPGGIGKTRLSLQAAADSINTFKHGVFFVSLAPISTAASILPTIADALNFPLSGSSPKEQLLNYLSEKEMLLVLDNFEHLIAPFLSLPEGGGDLLSEMIVRAPQLKLLVTSRERLNLQEEWGVEVSGLRVPTRTVTHENSLETYEGIQLFLQRAQRARPGFTLSDENCPHIVRICQLVEGMPLGLELAAAWVRMMTCQEIAQEIDTGLDFLTTSLRNVPERHQSLRGVFEQSWQLLLEKERAVFRKLSVFRGGFHRRAAERVAGATLPLLSALVDKSLLRPTRSGRYEIHELLRQYAAERLNQIPDEMEEAQDRHAEYYLTFLQQRTDALKGWRQIETLAEIAADYDNVQAGWRWASTQRNVTVLRKSADGLLLFCENQGRFLDGRSLFRQALERLSSQKDTKIVLARLLRGQGWFSVRLGFLQQGFELLQQSVSLLRQIGNLQQDLAFSLFWLALTYGLCGQPSRGKLPAQECLALYTEMSDRWGIGFTLGILGLFATYQGEYREAHRHLQESIRLLKQVGEHIRSSNSFMFLGIVTRIQGKYREAKQVLEEGLQSIQDFPYQMNTAYILRELGYLALAQGSYPQAQERMQESLTRFKELEARNAMVFPLDGLGSIARLSGKYNQAEQLHREGLTIAENVGEGRGIALCLHNLGRLAYNMGDYPTAEQHLQESLTRYNEIGNNHGIASARCRLGYVACAMGSSRYQEASQYLNQALEIAVKIGAPPLILDILVGMATPLATNEPERAIELLALALHHPASEQETKDKASRLLAELASELPSELIASAQERGKAKELDKVVAEILEGS